MFILKTDNIFEVFIFLLSQSISYRYLNLRISTSKEHLDDIQ